MPLTRQRWRNFSRGWWPADPPEQMPPNTLRRGVGINAIKLPPLQSRWGATQLYALDAHSLYRFNDVRFQGVTTDLLRDGLVITSGLNGQRLTFTRMPPSPGSVDYLFVAGGGRLFKVAPDGTVSNWGIVNPGVNPTASVSAETAPPDGFIVTPGAAGPLTGQYPYVVTFRDSTTGLQTNHNPTPVIATPSSQEDDITNLPLGAGTIDSRVIYRKKTGALAADPYYQLTIVADNVTTTFTDNIFDSSLGPAYTFLTGTYKYRITFLNTTTGSRSNPNPDAVVATPVGQNVLLSNIQVSSDAQVDRVEIWRTAANQEVFFKLDEVGNGTTTYLDSLADDNLQDLELRFDNIVPDASFNDAVSPYVGRMWWARDSEPEHGGRVWYSPVGRPEAVIGFIEINNGDDPTQKLVFWGGALYCFTNGKIIQILGSDEPFTFNEVFAAPGTVEPFSVVATPYGVLYQAVDGIRLFDGAKSTIVGYDAAARLFQGVEQEGIPPFHAVLGAYNRREVWFSDTDRGTTIVVDPTDGTLRVAVSGVQAMYYEPDTEDFVASFAGRVALMEPPGVTTDAGVEIDFEIETGGVMTDVAVKGLVQRIYLDVDTAGQQLLPTVILDEVEYAMPAFITNGRPAEPPEITVGVWGRVLTVRLSGTLTEQVSIYGIEADIYVPQPVAPQGEAVSA